MIRLTIFIIALILAVGAVEPSGPWLVTLAVLAGIELLRRPRFRTWLSRRHWRQEFDW
jgi:MYXO-CTERM domain-containing protein